MALDGLFLHCLLAELKEELLGAKLEKVYQPSKQELLFCFRNRGEAKRLLISASGNAPRLHLTSAKFDNPEKPPMLTMLLRKNLSGAVLTDLRQHRTDRIAFLDFDATNEIGDRVTRTVAVEIMAQYSNIILIGDGDKIIDSVKRVDLLRSSVRQILPGLRYALPPAQGKPSLLAEGGVEMIARTTAQSSEKSAVKALLFAAEGMSPVLCREILFRSETSDLLSELQTLQKNIIARNICPSAVYGADHSPIDFSFIPLTQYGGCETVTYPTLSALLDSYYFERERTARAKAKAEDLFRNVNSIIERISKKIASQTAELADAADRDEKKIFGDLINANLYCLEKGAFYYDLADYYHDMVTVRIPADPRLSPAQNAQKYYKEYRKAATAEKILTEQIQKGNEDLNYMRSVQDLLSRADSEKEFAAIRDELISTGFIKQKNAKSAKKRPAALPYIEAVSPNGFRVVAGRNNLQNDQLTFRTASKTDIWFHVQKFHGSHVILFTDGGKPLPEDYVFAARLAVANSEVKGSSRICVDYTSVRQIKKPQGAKPGFVIYHVYKTMVV